MKKRKTILDLTNTEVKEFFLKDERYFTFDLPEYFSFENLLKKLNKKIGRKSISSFYNSDKNKRPGLLDNVNYKLFGNKDGKYAWRLLELIHPALYLELVNIISKKDNWEHIKNKFSEFKESKIECVSIPVVSDNKSGKKEKAEQILNWWEYFEQQSIEISLKYKYVLQTDITDCYGSMYTHSIPWALHTKPVAKQNAKDKKLKLFGDEIDFVIRQMRKNQTNGIPQGSILMDFIAEMVLGYIDLELSEKIKNIKPKLKNNDYKILRYRDDYRIFTNDPEIAKSIAKELANVLADMGMRLSEGKTKISDDIIVSSIKKDKMWWLLNYQYNKNSEKQLLIILQIAKKYPNSGILANEMENFFLKIDKKKKVYQYEAISAILAEIIFYNPRVYAYASSIFGKILSTLKNKRIKKQLYKKMENKLKALPSSELLELWLQRMILKVEPSKIYDGKLSKKVIDEKTEVWNSDWLDNSIKKLINDTKIVDKNIINKMDEYPDEDTVLLFNKKTRYNSY